MVDCISYRGGYEYQLQHEARFQLRYRPDTEKTIDSFVRFGTDGELVLAKGYAWDGPSGPTIDTKNFMRASLVHDALYQLMREEQLAPRDEWQKKADDELYRICREDRMSRVRAWYVHRAVRRFGKRSTDPENRKEITTAPRGCRPP